MNLHMLIILFSNKNMLNILLENSMRESVDFRMYSGCLPNYNLEFKKIAAAGRITQKLAMLRKS